MKYKSYAFDLDDNLLKMPSKIYLEDLEGNERAYSTIEFEKIRPRMTEQGLHLTKSSLRDFKKDSSLFEDIKFATKEKSWEFLEECICDEASIFAIITSRGHSPQALKDAIKTKVKELFSKEQFNKFEKKFREKYPVLSEEKCDEELFDIYLDMCKFYPIKYGEDKNNPKTGDLTELKVEAFKEFKGYVEAHVKENFGKNFTITFGFSDDSKDHIKEFVKTFPDKKKFHFYLISNKQIEKILK